jgi:WD40 repeat protein
VFETRAAAHAMAFSPDGKWLLVGDDRTPRLFPLFRGEPRALKGHLSAVKAAAFSPDGRFAVTAGGDRKIKLHDVAKAKVLATMQGYASVVAFLEGGTRLLYAGFDCGAIVEVPSGKPVRKLAQGFFDCAAVSADGLRVAVKTGREEALVQVLDLQTGKKLFERTFDPVRLAALDRKGERLVLARAAMLAQGTSLEVWSIADNERLLPKGEGHTGGITGLTTVGRVAVSASADRSVKLWDLDTGREIDTVAGPHDVGAFALSPDGRVALSARAYGRESTIQRWDLAGLRLDGTIDAGDLGSARALAISPDGRTAAASFVRRAALFDVATGKRRAVLEKHKAQVDAIAFSVDGKCVVTGAADHLVKVWSTTKGTELHALRGHTSFVHALACLPDGTCVSGSGELLRWDLATGELVAKASIAGEVSSLAASPDGRWLLVLGPFDRTIQLWPTTLKRVARTIELEDIPAAAVFAGPTTVLVGTKGGRILRIAIEDATC